MTVLVIWILLGVACAAIANSKGRRAWLWAILGIIGGVVSLLIIVCLPKVVPEKKCPICANILKEEAMICHYCGYDFIKRTHPSTN